MEESWRGADHTQTSWGAADRCHESTAVIGTARMEGGEAERREEGRKEGKAVMERDGGKERRRKKGVGEGERSRRGVLHRKEVKKV